MFKNILPNPRSHAKPQASQSHKPHKACPCPLAAALLKALPGQSRIFHTTAAPTTTNLYQPPPTSTNHHQPPPTTTNHHQPPPTTTNHHQPPQNPPARKGSPRAARPASAWTCPACARRSRPGPQASAAAPRAERPPEEKNKKTNKQTKTAQRGHANSPCPPPKKECTFECVRHEVANPKDKRPPSSFNGTIDHVSCRCHALWLFPDVSFSGVDFWGRSVKTLAQHATRVEPWIRPSRCGCMQRPPPRQRSHGLTSTVG